MPNGPADFAFTATNGATPASFTLDDDADPTLSNTQVLTGLVDGQTYVVTETSANQAGFSLTGLVCTGGGADTTVEFATGVATIGFDAGETIVCTFTNTQAGATLTLQKAWVNLRRVTRRICWRQGRREPGRRRRRRRIRRRPRSTLNVFSGETVNLSEVLGAANLAVTPRS